MYILSTGCQWRAIPKDLPPRSTLHDYFDLWSWDGTLDRIHHALYVECRAAFHRQEWPHRVGLIPSIEDDRYYELGERVIATEKPQLLTATQRSRSQAWRRERILATGDTPWLTVADAMAEL